MDTKKVTEYSLLWYQEMAHIIMIGSGLLIGCFLGTLYLIESIYDIVQWVVINPIELILHDDGYQESYRIFFIGWKSFLVHYIL